MKRTRTLAEHLAYDGSEQQSSNGDVRARDPWRYASEDGFLVKDGKIRIYGFSMAPAEPRQNARVARRTPVTLTLKPGRYSWCTCGHSSSQPFCDNEHRQLGECQDRCAYRFQVLNAIEVTLCRCKRTQSPPFCDCQHEHLP